MDDADRAGNRIDQYEAEAVAAISKAAKTRSLIPIGACHYCGESIPQHHLFCSSECSVDHRFMVERKKANGE